MRLSDISEALDELSKWNSQLMTILDSAPYEKSVFEPDTRDEATKEANYKRENKIYSIMVKALKYHQANMGGRRWPEMEKVLLSKWGDPRMLTDYLSALSEDWPEGHDLLVKEAGRWYTSDTAHKYFLKKGKDAPELTQFYKDEFSADGIRRHLRYRLIDLQKNLQKEMENLKPRQDVVDPTGLEDRDEFGGHGENLTIGQMKKRIKTVEAAIALPDAELIKLAIDERPKSRATMDALRFRWAPPSARAYIDKFVK